MENDRQAYRKYCDNCRYEGIEPPSYMDWLSGGNNYDEPEVENLYFDDAALNNTTGKGQIMTNTINTSFKLGSYNVEAEAWFSGRLLVTTVYIEKTLIVNSTQNASDAYKSTSLTGAALKNYDEKWLRVHATNAVMSTLVTLVEEAAAA